MFVSSFKAIECLYVEGLDPAGPLFVDRDWSARLNPSCADLVDVIHTDGSFLGMLKAVGHIDFYPNGGYNQPGCPSESLQRLYDWENFTVFNSNTDTSSKKCFLFMLKRTNTVMSLLYS